MYLSRSGAFWPVIYIVPLRKAQVDVAFFFFFFTLIWVECSARRNEASIAPPCGPTFHSNLFVYLSVLSNNKFQTICLFFHTPHCEFYSFLIVHGKLSCQNFMLTKWYEGNLVWLLSDGLILNANKDGTDLTHNKDLVVKHLEWVDAFILISTV